ncbi:MAG: methyltransferase domain-containing protein [Flavobacteriaceae bacterium]|nr:methyltransferase domain-containing protein [Flavobacteriaceae bacterium]
MNKYEKFFYAEQQAGLYDKTIELAVPEYHLIHETLLEFLMYYFGIPYGKKIEDIEGTFIDIGAGTGTESISLLKKFPKLKILAIDFCRPMKLEFEKNYEKTFGKNNEKRYNYIVEDIFSEKCDFSELKKFLPSTEKAFAGVISAYCIHHFTKEEKQSVLKKMLSFIPTGGILINLDLFNYESSIFSKFAHDFDLNYIKNQFKNPDKKFIESRKIDIKERLKLGEMWIEHMNHANILGSIEEQSHQLKELGVSEVECIYKYFQQGLICGIK